MYRASNSRTAVFNRRKRPTKLSGPDTFVFVFLFCLLVIFSILLCEGWWYRISSHFRDTEILRFFIKKSVSYLITSRRNFIMMKTGVGDYENRVIRLWNNSENEEKKNLNFIKNSLFVFFTLFVSFIVFEKFAYLCFRILRSAELTRYSSELKICSTVFSHVNTERTNMSLNSNVISKYLKVASVGLEMFPQSSNSFCRIPKFFSAPYILYGTLCLHCVVCAIHRDDTQTM